MTILLVLIPVTLLFVIAGGVAFFWAVNHDQFDDMDTPALQPLLDGESDRSAAGSKAGADDAAATEDAAVHVSSEAPPR